MKERELMHDEESGRVMQAWYIERLGYGVDRAWRIKKHIAALRDIANADDIMLVSQYELYGAYKRIFEDFERLNDVLLAAYEYACGYDTEEFETSLFMLDLLQEHHLDPRLAFDHLYKLNEEAREAEEDEEDEEEEEKTSVDPKYPFASPDAIKEAEEIDKLAVAEDAYHKTVKTLFDILPEDPDELKDLIASCEVKLENMGENPND